MNFPTTRPHIGTFHARHGRLSPTGAATLARLLPTFGVGPGPVDPRELFPDDRPVVLEIGTGTGAATAELALEQPELNLLAAEVHPPGVASLLGLIDRYELMNVRVYSGDAVTLLDDLPSASLAGIRAFFPDPWPKLRQHKRRLVRADIVAMMSDLLALGGLLHLATDWPAYADRMLAVLTAQEGLRLEGVVPRPAWRPVTRYEAKARDAGRRIVDVMAVRVSPPAPAGTTPKPAS